MYSTYEAPFAGTAARRSAAVGQEEGHHPRRRPEPHRPGHRVRLLLLPRLPSRCKEAGYETIMINCNPETVSTDYDTSDRLYFEPLTPEDVLEIIDTERTQRHAARRHRAVRRPDAAQARRARWRRANVPILGTSPDMIDLAEDRDRFKTLLDKLKAAPAAERHRHLARRRARHRRRDRLSGRDPAVLRARRPRHGDRARQRAARPLRGAARRRRSTGRRNSWCRKRARC